MAGPAGNARAALVALALALATAAVYVPTGSYGFVSYDDPEYVAKNPHVLRGLSLDGVGWALSSVHHGNWHPVTTLSWMLECELFGVAPRVQHRVNVALHALDTVLLFLLFLRATGALWRSAVVAALFGLHPLHVESVAWISSRKDLLSAAFAFGTMHAYVGWVRTRRASRYAATLVLFALGLMSKPMLVTWPFVLLLFDVWPLGRLTLGASAEESRRRAAERARERAAAVRRAIVEKLPLLGLTAVSIALTVWAQTTGGALKATSIYPLGDRVANALSSWVAYLGRAVWPVDLAVLYPFPLHVEPWRAAVSALLLAAVTAVCVRERGRRPYLLVGWLWYVGTLVPVIGLVQVGVQASADRYTYLPLVGVFFAATWGVADVAERAPRLRPVLGAATVAALAVFGVLASRQVEVWQDSIALYQHGLRATGRNAVLANNLGIALADEDRHAEAIEVYEQGLGVPSPVVHVLHYNDGIALAAVGRHAEAIAHFDRALGLEPDNAEALFHRAGSLGALGRLEDAQRDLERTVELAPDEAEPEMELGLVLGKRGDLAGAELHLARAVELRPDLVDARINLAVAQLKSGNPAAAVLGLEQVLALRPGHEAALRYLEVARRSAARVD